MWVDFPILNPYSSHMALPMWVQRGTMLQIPHESLMGCPYMTHINTHLWPMWVLYLLLAGWLVPFVLTCSSDTGCTAVQKSRCKVITQNRPEMP